MTLANLDTNVVLAAVRSNRGASYQILSAVHYGRVVPALSVALFLEYEDVLTRPEHLAAAGLRRKEVIRLIQRGRCLVTMNLRDFAPARDLFDLDVVTPGQFLNMLEG